MNNITNALKPSDLSLEDRLWGALENAKSIFRLTKDPLVLDSMRVIQEALTDVVTSRQEHHELTELQSAALRMVDRMVSAKQTLGV